jgi:hypothetical protein
MINVKDQVYAAIKDVSTNVSDGYPTDWSVFPAIQYVEEDNKVVEFTDGKEQKAYVRYKIDIWNTGSTSATALQIDKAIAALGLRRTACGDVTDTSNYKHKLMRYEGIIDVDTQVVYQNI